MTKSIIKLLAASTAFVAASSAAHAQQSAGVSGYGGLGYSMHTGDDEDGGDQFFAEGVFAEGAISYGVFGGTLNVVGSYNAYNSGEQDEDPFDEENPGYGYSLSAHYLHDLNDATSVGGFVAYGEARADGDEEDFHTYYAIGAEAHHAFNSMLVGYAQLAIVNAENDGGGTSAQGPQNSPFLRAGINYNLTPSTTLYADVQLAGLLDFEDAGEDWLWNQVSLGGETLIDGTNFGITYDLTFYETIVLAGNDNDAVQDAIAASLGVRYYFGTTGQNARSQGIIGAPSSIAISALFPDFHN